MISAVLGSGRPGLTAAVRLMAWPLVCLSQVKLGHGGCEEKMKCFHVGHSVLREESAQNK